MSLRGRNRKPCRKPFPSATMSPDSPAQNGQESKRDVRSEGTALNCLSHISGYIITIRLLNYAAPEYEILPFSVVNLLAFSR